MLKHRPCFVSGLQVMWSSPTTYWTTSLDWISRGGTVTASQPWWRLLCRAVLIVSDLSCWQVKYSETFPTDKTYTSDQMEIIDKCVYVYIYISRSWRASSGQRPLHDTQGVGSLHWSIWDGLPDVPPDVEALRRAVLWLLLPGVARSGGEDIQCDHDILAVNGCTTKLFHLFPCKKSNLKDSRCLPDSFEQVSNLLFCLLQELVSHAQEPKSCWRRLINIFCCCHYRFYIHNKVNPVDDGVLDHMVRITTGINSPFIATACHTVCPGMPPCIGRRRPAVQEILRRQRIAELKRMGPDRLNHYKRYFQNSRVLLIPRSKDRRASLQPLLSDVAEASTVAMRRASLLPLNMLRRSSVRPGITVPRVRLCKAPEPTFIPDKFRRTSDYNQLQPPKWDYKMKRIERRKEEERQRLLPLTRRRWTEVEKANEVTVFD